MASGTELPDLRVHMIGGLRAITEGRELKLSGRAKLLLAFVLLHPGRFRNDVATAIGSAEGLCTSAEEALGNLYRATSELRSALGTEWVPSRSAHILARRPGWVDIDIVAAMDCEQAVVYCKQHGELLAGFPELEWVAEARATHHEQLTQRLCQLVSAYRQAGRSTDTRKSVADARGLLPNHYFDMVVVASGGDPSPVIDAVTRWPHDAKTIMAEVRRIETLLTDAGEGDEPYFTWSTVMDTVQLMLGELERVTRSGVFYPVELIDAVATLIVRAETHQVEGTSGCRLKLALVRNAYGCYRTALAEIAPLLAATPSPEVAYMAGGINMNLGRLEDAKRLFDSVLASTADLEMRLCARDKRDLWLASYRGEHQAVIAIGKQLIKDPYFHALPTHVRADIMWRIGIAYADLGDRIRANHTLKLAHSFDADSPNPHRPRVLAQAALDAGDRSSYTRRWEHFRDILRASSGRGLWPHYHLAEARRRTEESTSAPEPKRALSYALADANNALKDWQQTGYLHGYCAALLQRGTVNRKLGRLAAAATDYIAAYQLAYQTQLEVKQQAYDHIPGVLCELSQRDQDRVRHTARQQTVQGWGSFFDTPQHVLG